MFTFASLFTLGLIFGFIFVIVLLAAQFGGVIDLGMVIGLTVAINALMWLISPFFMDLMFRWIYKYHHLKIEDLHKRSPRIADFIRTICGKYNLPIPKIRLIDDDNPTAFVFGSGAFNARLAFSEGLFTYLEEDEMEAVIAHELGHIRRRDFIVMTMAQTGVQIIYELAVNLMRGSKNDDEKSRLVYVGMAAYVLYFVATYLLLFLSRTREYGADKFAAENIENPDSLSRALVKVAYGIVAKPESMDQKRLLGSTRALGLVDTQGTRLVGSAYDRGGRHDWNFVARILLFDLVSPWAKVLELGSTHPLTGKRIRVLQEMAVKLGKRSSIDMQRVVNEPYDKGRLYSGFWSGVFFNFLPHIGVLLGFIVTALFNQVEYAYASIPLLLGMGIVGKTTYRYPNAKAEKTSTFDLMSDVYANPARGKIAILDGKVIGRGDSGNQVSEDLMIQDSTGLVYLNYESAFASIGNFFSAIGKMRKLIGHRVIATGWFFRGVSAHVDLKTVTAEDSRSFRSRPAMWSYIGGFLMIGLGVVLGLAAENNVNLLEFL